MPAVEVRSEGPFACAAVTWQRGSGEYVATIVAKATYALEPEIAALLDEPDPVHEVDDHWDDDLRKSVRVPSDLAPVKSTYDVVVVGHAHAPKAAESAVIRVSVGSVDKVVEARVPSRFTPDGQLDSAAPALRMPLRYEVAPIGPDNPVGIDPTQYDAVSGRYRVPQLLPPNLAAKPGSSVPFTGVGPIAPSWRMRDAHLRAQDREWLSNMLDRPMPTGFDPAYFSVAPPDQRADERFRADERILLECLHPQHPRLVANLAGVKPMLSSNLGGSLPELVGDTLLFDSDRGLVTLTFRAQVPIDLRRQSRFEVHSGTRRELPRAPASARSHAGESTMKLEGRSLESAITEGLDTTNVDGNPDVGAVLPFLSAAKRPRLPSQFDSALPFRNSADAAPSSQALAPPSTRTTDLPSPPLSALRRSQPPAPGPPPPSPESRPRSTPAPPLAVPAPLSAIAVSPAPAPPPAPPAAVAPAPTPPATALRSPSAAPPPPPPPSSLRAAPSPALPVAPVLGASVALSRPQAPAPPPAITAGGATIGEQRAQAALPALVSDELRVRPASKPDPAVDPFQAAFPTAGKPPVLGSGGLKSAKIASDQAAEARPDRPADRRDAREAPESAAERRFLIDLLSFEPEVPRRLRRTKGYATLLADFHPPRAPRRLDEADSERDKDRDERARLDVLRVLSCGDPLEVSALGAAVDMAIEDANDLEVPLLLASGELKPTFDEIEALKAATRIAQPLSATDKRLVAAVAVANEVVAAQVPPSAETAQALFKQLEGAVSGLNLPPRYLAESVERTLLDTRAYKKRVVLGDTRIRCELATPGGSPWPCYVPEPVGTKLPLLTSFPVVALVEARPREDAFESHPEALFVVALGRVLKRARR